MYSLRYCRRQIWYSVLQLTIPVQTEHKSQIPLHARSSIPTCASSVQHTTFEHFLFKLSHFSVSQEGTVQENKEALTWTIETFKAQWLLYIPHTVTLQASTYFCNVDTFCLLWGRKYIVIQIQYLHEMLTATFQIQRFQQCNSSL